MRDLDGIRVATDGPAGRVDKTPVVHPGAWRQLQRTSMVDRGVNQLVVEEGHEVGTKLGVPLATGRGGIGLRLGRDGSRVERFVEHVSSLSVPKNWLCLA